MSKITITDILTTVWGKVNGFICIATISTSKQFVESFFEYPAEMPEVVTYISKHTDANLYFCPHVFKETTRQKSKALPAYSIFWADIDTVKREDIPDNLQPDILWNSSDNNLQGIWLLDTSVVTEDLEKTNKALTYAIGADKSGWDVTQLLRIPGTMNYKYNPAQKGKVLAYAGVPKQTYKEYCDILNVHKSTIEQQYDLTPRIKQLISATVQDIVVGERSERLWEIAKGLCEANVPIVEALDILRDSPFNKFKGRADADYQVSSLLLKADKEHKTTPKVTKEDGKYHVTGITTSGIDLTTPPVLDVETNLQWAIPFNVMTRQHLGKPTWLVEDVWQDNTYGIIAGEPKTFKSMQAIDMGLSVASGKPYLGVFPVLHTGAVLYIQEENGEQTVQDRILKIAHYKGLTESRGHYMSVIDSLPFYTSNNCGINLTSQDSRTLIENTIRKIKPRLVILDPLYRMFGSTDENSATEVSGVLSWLTDLRNIFKCSIVVCHHYNKNSQGSRGGSRIRGSSAFHAWVGCASYVKVTSENNVVEVEREFRAFSKPNDFKLSITLGDPGELLYVPEVTLLGTGGTAKSASSMGGNGKPNLALLAQVIATPRTKEELQQLTGMNKRKCDAALLTLESLGYVTKVVNPVGGRGLRAEYLATDKKKEVTDEV